MYKNLFQDKSLKKLSENSSFVNDKHSVPSRHMKARVGGVVLSSESGSSEDDDPYYRRNKDQLITTLHNYKTDNQNLRKKIVFYEGISQSIL